MSTEQSRKRGGDESSEDPPSKIPPIVDGSSAPHDVVLIVKGQKFYCLKEKLAEHSTFFEKMFFSEFDEKNKEEVDIGEVEPDVFQLFIDATNGINSMSDEYSEVALVAAIFLESAIFEEKILKHFAETSEISLQDQFKMAEDHKSNRLMSQVFASIKDKYELDEILPKNLDSLCNSTKNLVMQRSLELLGIRKPPSPPLPEDPDQVFEIMISQMVDQIEIQNHQGEVLKDQVELLFDHMITEVHFTETDKEIIRGDLLVQELLDQLRNAHEQSERNFIHAQIQVSAWKELYTILQNRVMDDVLRASLIPKTTERLRMLAAKLNRDEKSRSQSHKVTLGNRDVDEVYRRLTAEAMQQNQTERPRNVNYCPVWLESIHDLSSKMEKFAIYAPLYVPRPRPDNRRAVSNQASSRIVDDLLINARNVYYRTLRLNQPYRNQAAADIVRQVEAENPREQDQEGN